MKKVCVHKTGDGFCTAFDRPCGDCCNEYCSEYETDEEDENEQQA